MTRQEFLKRRAAYHDRVALGAIGFGLGLVPEAMLVQHIYRDCPDWPLPLRLGVIALLGGGLLVGVIVLMKFAEQQERRFGMTCPHCREKIGGRRAVDLPAGTCRHCRQSILQD